MSRQEALDCLQEEIDAYGTKQQHDRSTTSSSRRTPATTTTTTPATSNPSNNRPAPAKTAPTTRINPFIEIREEIDGSGQVVRSEAIDVSKQLEYLKKSENDEMSSAAEDGVQTERAAAAAEVEFEDDVEMMTEQENNRNTLRPLSDTEYDTLAERLEELARLEEQAESDKAVNLKSSTKLQSRGWSKGFLNQKAPRKKNNRKSPPPAAAAAASKSPTAKTKAIVFGQDEVREIPRVGERSVRNMLTKPPSSSSSSSRPLEQSIFSGIVQETGAAPAPLPVVDAAPPQVSRFAQQQRQSVAPPAAAQPTTKKLSRFAQERQQGRR